MILLVEEIKKLFSDVNKGVFSNKLETPTISIQTDKKVIFKFSPEFDTLIVGSKFAKASLDEILSSLFHEMVHISNFSKGIIDCTSNQYHNKKFVNSALDAGLFVMPHKTQGWGVTKLEITAKDAKHAREPSEKSLSIRRKVIDSLTFDRGVIQKSQKAMSKQLASRGHKICLLRYVCDCPPPHNSIRSGRRPDGDHPLQITCNQCHSEFKISATK